MNKAILLIGAVVIVGVLAFFAGQRFIIPIGPNGDPDTASTSSSPVQPTSTAPAKEDRIRVTSPRPGEFISSPVLITGEARGTWYFEAVFPVQVLDSKGKVIAQGQARAQSDWMTENFVPFRAELVYAGTPLGDGRIILKRDNPSGLPQNDAQIEVPIKFEPPSAAGGGDGEKMPPCIITGCSSQLCADREIITDCAYKPEYACYRNEKCERQQSGACGWTMNPDLQTCLDRTAQ